MDLNWRIEMTIDFKIIYTSDTHGRITAYDFMSKSYGLFGLSRLSTYLKGLEEPYLLLDNGDFLQGSPLLDVTRKEKISQPVAKVFNQMGYQYVTVGNHDFNFGLEYLNQFQSSFSGEILCANLYHHEKPYFKTHVIHEIQGVRVALIGLVTEYIPIWERKENIPGLEFRDVVEVTKDLIQTHQLKNKADLIVVMYHGGYEKNPSTDEAYGQKTVENKGYQLFDIPEVDLLLTGHQHIPQIHTRDKKITTQTSHNASDAGIFHIKMQKSNQGNELIDVKAELIKLSNYPVDLTLESVVKQEIHKTERYLSHTIGTLLTDMTIHSPLSARISKHPLFQLINQIQMEYTGAMISCASLPNDTHGLPKSVTLNDIFVSFPFENDLVVLEVTGKHLLEALEQNAKYFELSNDKIVISPKFLHPKVEHYNYDVYDGISYEFHIGNPIGYRVKNVMFKNHPIEMNQVYTLVLNSYRSTGSGGFDMFKDRKILKQYPVSYVELISTYITSFPDLRLNLINNVKIMK
jgi:2',3'-cyclic-nucleotide 2'-phosphodiesterase / 3'-nucleotidase